MAARPEHDANLPLAQEAERAHHVVGALHLVIDVLDAGAIGREQRDRVMHFVDPQQRRVADAVAHARIAYLRPERLVARGVRRAQADVAEAGDAGVAYAVVTLAAMGAPPHQLDTITARVVERDQL